MTPNIEKKSEQELLQVAEKLADLTFELLERCQEKRERIASSLGLTVAEFKLVRSFGSEEVISVGEIARRMDLSSSRLTRIIDGLVEKELVNRDIDPDDRRMMEVSLTLEGKKLQSRLLTEYVGTHREIVSLLPPGASDSVIFAMEHLRDAMKSWSKEE